MFNGTLFLLLKWGISHFHFALGTTVYVAGLTSTLQVRFYWYNLLWCISLIIFSSGIDLHKFISNHVKRKSALVSKHLHNKETWCSGMTRLSPEMVFIYPIVSVKGWWFEEPKGLSLNSQIYKIRMMKGKNKRFGIQRPRINDSYFIHQPLGICPNLLSFNFSLCKGKNFH